jgi:hypothetical protein
VEGQDRSACMSPRSSRSSGEHPHKQEDILHHLEIFDLRANKIMTVSMTVTVCDDRKKAIKESHSITRLSYLPFIFVPVWWKTEIRKYLLPNSIPSSHWIGGIDTYHLLPWVELIRSKKSMESGEGKYARWCGYQLLGSGTLQGLSVCNQWVRRLS